MPKILYNLPTLFELIPVFLKNTKPICEFLSCLGGCSNQVPTFLPRRWWWAWAHKKGAFFMLENDVALFCFLLKDQVALPLWNPLIIYYEAYFPIPNSLILNTRSRRKEGCWLVKWSNDSLQFYLIWLIDIRELELKWLRRYMKIINVFYPSCCPIGLLHVWAVCFCCAHTHTPLKIRRQIL